MSVEEKVIELRSKKINLDKLENPKLARVFQERVHNGEEFMFFYSDHTDHSIGNDYSDYSDHYSDNHWDHKEKHRDMVGGYGGSHTDEHSDKHR